MGLVELAAASQSVSEATGADRWGGRGGGGGPLALTADGRVGVTRYRPPCRRVSQAVSPG